MTIWPSVKAKLLLAALKRNGWKVLRTSGSHKTLAKSGCRNFVFAFHDNEEVGPRMLARIAKNTGIKPDDL